MSQTDAYVATILPHVEGWFYPKDVVAFIALDRIQKSWGITGALAEVGVYQGKSLGLLATLRSQGERIYGFDLFDAAYPGTLARTQDTLRRAAGSLDHAVLVSGSSVELPEGKLRQIIPEPVRFLHVDGSHEYQDALSDLNKFGALVTPRGVIAVDDYYDRDFPGVCAATNEFVRRSDFVPFLSGLIKIYLCRKDQLRAYIEWVLRFEPFQKAARFARFSGQPMLIGFADKPEPHERVVAQMNQAFLGGQA